jgi:flagellar biosynthesis protein FlhF
MRLRTFEARTMAEALRGMRRALGEGAVLVASEELAGRVRVTAAVPPGSDSGEPAARPPEEAPLVEPRALLTACLAHHAVPPALQAALLAELGPADPTESAAALTQLLERRFRFLPLELPLPRTLAVVGPPGAGKTASVVRLTAQSVLGGQRVQVVSTDVGRAGALAQLTELLRPLGLAPVAAADAGTLVALVREVPPELPVLVDTRGVNPFEVGEVAALTEQLRAARAEPVLVLPAGLDVEDSIDAAGHFALMGARRMLVSKLDAARRLGGILAAADVGLAFAGAGINAAIGRGVPTLSAAGLARVLLHRAAPAEAGAIG